MSAKKNTIWLSEKSSKNKVTGQEQQYFIGEIVLAKREIGEIKKMFAKIVRFTDKKTGEVKTAIALDIVEKTGV